MFFMVRVSKPLFLQVCRLPVPPCFDDRHDGLFLVLCPSWPGSIMVTPWTLLVVPRGSSSWFLLVPPGSSRFFLGWSFPCGPSPGPFLVVPPWVVLSLWSLPWSLPRGSFLVFSSWFLLGWSFPFGPSSVPSLWFPLALVLSLSLTFSLYLPPVSLCSSSLRYPSHVYTVVVDLFAIYLLSHSTYSARNTFLTPLHHIFLNF